MCRFSVCIGSIMFFWSKCGCNLRNNNIQNWRLILIISCMFQAMASCTQLRNVTSETVWTNLTSWTESPSLDLSSTVSLLVTVGRTSSQYAANSEIRVPPALSSLGAQYTDVADVSHLQTIVSSPSLVDASYVSLFPSFSLTPVFQSETGQPEKILTSHLYHSLSNQVIQTTHLNSPNTLLTSPYKFSKSTSLVKASSDIHNSVFQETLALMHFNPTKTSQLLDSSNSVSQNYWKITLSRDIDLQASPTESWSLEPSKDHQRFINYISSTHELIEITHTKRLLNDFSHNEGIMSQSLLVSTQSTWRLESSTAIPTHTPGVFSGLLTFPDGGGTWSLTGIMSMLSSKQQDAQTYSAGSPRPVTSNGAAANRTNDSVRLEENEWAVPVVAVLASTTLVTIVVLMVVCARHYRATRVRRNMPEDEETGTTSYHQHHLPQKSRQEYDTRFVPSRHENDQVLPPFDRVDTPTSSRFPGNRYSRKPWSNLPRNESREYFEMFDLEKSGQSKLSSMDSVDNGEEWTTKYVQETRLCDYGIGDLRNQNNNQTLGEQSKKFQSGFGISPRIPRRDESPVFGTAPRFSRQSAALSFEEVRWSDVQLRQQKVNTIPPVKPKRVFTFDKLQVPYSPSRQRLAGLVSRGFISDVNNQGFSSGVDNQGFSSDFESERSHSKHHKEEGDDTVEGHIQSRLKGNNYNQKLSISPDVQMRNMYGVDDRRHRILKCASYDESKLQVESRQPLYKNNPTRKISTVSEPARELLDIPESSIAKSKWMYPSVDNLDQLDSPYRSDEHVNIVYSRSEQSNTCVTLQTGDFSSTVQENKSPGNVFFIKSEDNKKSNMETSQTDLGAKKSKPDFIFPIISKASKKILEVRNSRKLENAKAFETHSQENPSSRRLSYLSDEDVSKVENVKTVGSASPCSVSQSVPKIILTNESEEDEGDIVQGQGKMSKLKTTRGVRRIARANNPFLIEIDQSSSIKSEKFRRASAPSMPSNVDPNVHLVVSQGLTRSSSSELLRAPMLAADVSRTTSSWSELYNLVTDSPEHDSEQRERVKKMIDDRYEALFGNKTPGYALADRLEGRDLWSPRIAKRRLAAKSKAASLERDSSLTHIEEKDSETGNYPSVLASDRRRHSDEPWRPREDVPRISSLSEGNSSTRKMLTHGTDGCDHPQSMSANFDDDSIHLDRSPKMKEFSDMDIAKTRNKGQQTMSLNKDKINLSKKVIDPEVSDSEDGARKSRENNEIHGDIGQNSKRDQSLIISNQANFLKVSEATLTEGRNVEAQVKKLEKFDLSKKELPKDQESDENRNTQKNLCSFDYLHNTNQPKNEKSSLVPRTPEGSTHRFTVGSSPESLENNYLPTIHEPELLGLGFGEYADKIVESNENTNKSKTASKTTTRDISENAQAIIYSGQRKATLQNQNQNDDELSPLRIQSAISSNAPNNIHEQTASSPSKLRKSKVADDEFVQMLKTEERPYFSDGLHDSLPSSKDTSFIDFDTSGEDNQEVDYDVNYFDCLLSSSV